MPIKGLETEVRETVAAMPSFETFRLHAREHRYDLGVWWPVYNDMIACDMNISEDPHFKKSKVRFKRLDLRFLEMQNFPLVNTQTMRQIPRITGQAV
eukprot:sb/3479063/